MCKGSGRPHLACIFYMTPDIAPAFAALVSRLYVGLSIPLRGIQILQIPGDHADISASSVLQKARCESVGSDVKKHCIWCQRLARPRVT